MDEKRYTPVIGELVEASGHFGMFEVVEVDREVLTVNIRNLSYPIYVAKTVSWSEIQPRRDFGRLYFKFEDGLEHRSGMVVDIARSPRVGQILAVKGGLRSRVLSVEQVEEPFGLVLTAACTKPGSGTY